MIRPGHPLHGLDLPVWGRLRLGGAAMAVVVLPDGSKKRIPAAWTRAGDGTGTAGPAAASSPRPVICCAFCGWFREFPRAPRARRSRLHGSHLARRTTVQPAQLSLLPDQVPAPPSQLAGQLPPPIARAAAAILARLIIQAAQPGSPAGATEREVSGGE